MEEELSSPLSKAYLVSACVQTHLKVLKSKNVQDADGSEVFSAPDAAVQFVDDPVETLSVKCHGHGVPGVHRLHTQAQTIF